MKLPWACGPISAALRALLSGGRGSVPEVTPAEVLHDRDFQLALAMAYEVNFRGFDAVDDDMEWDPAILAARARLESTFELALRQEIGAVGRGDDVTESLKSLVRDSTGVNLSGYMAKQASLDDYREFVGQRSVYHLREADAHTFGIPRLSGRAKSALVEIQSDEYGGGRPGRMHSELFAQLMRSLGMCDEYGSFWDHAMAETFATVNCMSLFGLHRRLRGALAGHLAVLEMTSTEPNRRYGNGLRRLGFGAEARRFFDEHVEADAVHQELAAVDLCGSVVAAEPGLGDQVLFGAACCLRLDENFAEALLERLAARLPG